MIEEQALEQALEEALSRKGVIIQWNFPPTAADMCYGKEARLMVKPFDGTIDPSLDCVAGSPCAGVDQLNQVESALYYLSVGWNILCSGNYRPEEVFEQMSKIDMFVWGAQFSRTVDFSANKSKAA